MINTNGKSLEKKETHLLYNGDVRLEFTPSGHRYKIFHKGVELFGTIGTTTCLGILDKPALVQWSANVTNEAWINGLAGQVPDELLIAKLSKEAPLAWRIKRDDAGDIGTLIHAWIEKYIQAKIDNTQSPGAPINDMIQKAVLRFIEWEKNEGVSFIATEKKVYSLKHNIAGIVDFIYKTKEGKLGIGDIKTSKGIYDTMYLQVCAYQYMLQEETPSVEYSERTIVKVGKTDGEIEVKKVERYNEYATAFLACALIHKTLKPVKKV